MKEKQNNYLYIIGIGFLILTTFGGTYAFYTATATNSAILGNVYSSGLSLNMTTTKKATSLIPLSDSKVERAITQSSPCVDNNSYEVCSMYKLTLTNNGNADTFVGSLVTTSSTYTNNLKYQIFTKSNSTYTAVTDQITISNTANAENVMKKNNNTVSVQLNNQATITYYLVIWLSDTGSNQQTNDTNKTYNGSVVFSSIYGAEKTSQIIS